MLRRNLEAEYDRHLRYQVKERVFDEFTERCNESIADSSKTGTLPKVMEKPINRAGVFYGLIEEQYIAKLRECIENIKELFARHNISFRLIDIDNCMHGYHRMTMSWTVLSNHEYVIDFIFDSSQDDPFESFYRLGHIDGCGIVLNGDILENDSRRLFEDNADLPDWFVRGLQHNS